MAFFKRGRHANYSILNGFSWHVPGIGGLFAFMGWLALGFLISQLISVIILLCTGEDMLMLALDADFLQLLQLIVYPFLFLPAMIASKYLSNRNMYFVEGVKLDSPVKGKMSLWKAGALCCLATFGLAFLMDLASSLLPEMSDNWQAAMEALVGGNVFISFICVSIMAPFFEEWFIRGILLRGLLNFKRADGSRGMSPAIAIIITAGIFGFIHGNIWQALPAFALGCLFGYVYYKTGSLKLTMLMHAFNNTASLVASQLLPDEAVASWADIIPAPQLYAVSAACLAIVILVVLQFRKIKTPRNGGCELIPVEAPSEVPLP
ncbi:MAG: CPBP family intramembrane metalloprotease [Bacteroidales bacterium]|nr:CPBP family intramembrane metalloprotease [Bacteroidales bacterium]